MQHRLMRELTARAKGARLISVDVFDTLLLRNGSSERSRLISGERRFAALLASQGRPVDAELLLRARIDAQRFAYRALDVDGGEGEVRLVDVVSRQLAVLGLPRSFVDARVEIEVTIEEDSLAANRPLAAFLNECRVAGARIVAVSDTALSAAALSRLMARFHKEGLIDRIYASADEGATKRHGELFRHVSAAEAVPLSQMLHLGDDAHADVAVPRRLGIGAVHLPRPALRGHLRKADGAVSEIGRQLTRRSENKPAPPVTAAGAEGEAVEALRFAFGRDVFGPIVTEFCVRIWLYSEQAAASGETALLFLTRGGIGIRHAFEEVLSRLELPTPVRRETLMVSRLVAARAALLAGHRSSLDELGREFRKESFAEVAAALCGRGHDLPAGWDQRFEAAKFHAMLRSAEGAAPLADITRQNAMFTEHLKAVTGEARRIVLCDTGLYGSTQRLLAAGFPGMSFETIQFARSNYKGLSEEHFPRTSGLMVQRDVYNPVAVESCVLRYWQLVESLFEPAVASVKLFHRGPDGAIASNAGLVGHGELDPTTGNALLAGVMAYVGGLTPERAAGAMQDAEQAWRRLSQAITRPTAHDLACLDVGERSVDFGRSRTIRVITIGAGQTASEHWRGFLGQSWREGAIMRQFTWIGPALLAGLSVAHLARAGSARLRRSSRKQAYRREDAEAMNGERSEDGSAISASRMPRQDGSGQEGRGEAAARHVLDADIRYRHVTDVQRPDTSQDPSGGSARLATSGKDEAPCQR